MEWNLISDATATADVHPPGHGKQARPSHRKLLPLFKETVSSPAHAFPWEIKIKNTLIAAYRKSRCLSSQYAGLPGM